MDTVMGSDSARMLLDGAMVTAGWGTAGVASSTSTVTGDREQVMGEGGIVSDVKNVTPLRASATISKALRGSFRYTRLSSVRLIVIAGPEICASFHLFLNFV